MKLLVFAHTPPPHHGQSYMVQLMLDGFGGDHRHLERMDAEKSNPYGIECYHVNAQVSKELEDIGNFRLGKLFLLIGFCCQAIWCHFKYGVDNLYFIPAPGKRSALYRDWLVMLMCRPFFKRIILHWHAAGLAKWLETHVQMRTRAYTYSRMKEIDLSIVLSQYNRADAEKLLPRNIRVVSNGIPDPCPDFETRILPRRRARFAGRKKLAAREALTNEDLENTGGDPRIFRVFYLAHCTREKGLFDAISGILLANQMLTAANSPLSMQLIVAGNFFNPEERMEFDRITASVAGEKCIHYAGFLTGPGKEEALREADLFCFPTYYQNENQPVNLIEAMAFGLPILTTRWRSIPELLPADYQCLVDIRSPEQIARVLLECLIGQPPEFFRDIFLRHFSVEQYLAGLAASFHGIESNRPVTAPNFMAVLPP